jgi:hypothetical protein
MKRKCQFKVIVDHFGIAKVSSIDFAMRGCTSSHSAMDIHTSPRLQGAVAAMFGLWRLDIDGLLDCETHIADEGA